MYKLIKPLHRPPISVGAGAIYHYDPALIEICQRKSKYDDEGFNLCRVIGTEFQKRIWVPRNMASSIPKDFRAVGLDQNFLSRFKARNPEQTRFVNEAVALLKKGANFVAEAPPGFGKTICSAEIIARVRKKTIVIVTKEDILDQWVTAFENVLGLQLGKGIGIIKGDKIDVAGRAVVIAMVNSVAKEARYSEGLFQDFGFMVVDECHRIGADFFSQACFRVPALLRMGVSATPYRKDGREEVIEAHLGPVMVRTEAESMPFKVIVEKSPWSCPLKRKTDKDGKLVVGPDGKIVMVPIPHTAMRCGHIIRMITHNHARNLMLARVAADAFKKGRSVLVQSDTKDHLDILTALISSSGVHPGKITQYVGGLTKAQREAAKEGAIIMATYMMTKEATDIPKLDLLIMATPKSDVVQIVGRIRRFVEDKNMPCVYDIQDDTSPVFAGYARNRLEWYKSQGASVSVHKQH